MWRRDIRELYDDVFFLSHIMAACHFVILLGRVVLQFYQNDKLAIDMNVLRARTAGSHWTDLSCLRTKVRIIKLRRKNIRREKGQPI